MIKHIFIREIKFPFEHRGLKFEITKSLLDSLQDNELTHIKIKNISRAGIVLTKAHNENDKSYIVTVPWGRSIDDILEIVYGKIMSNPSTVVCVDGSIRWKGLYIS